MKKDGKLSNQFGTFEFNEIIGKSYGHKFVSKNNKGFLYILKPNPLLLTNSIPHRT